MKIGEHDLVVLAKDMSEKSLMKGDIGTVVHIYDEGAAFEVEFTTILGCTAAVVTLASSDVRSVEKDEMPHARQMAAS